MTDQNVFEVANNIAKRDPHAFLENLIPGGDFRGNDYLPLNPTRNDKSIGSLTIDIESGTFIDYADDDFKGGDFVALVAKVQGIQQMEAAKYIMEWDGQTAELPPMERAAAKKLEWTPIIPAKKDPDTDLFKRFGKEYLSQMPSNFWTYYTADNGIAFIVARYELNPDMDKQGRHKIYTGWTYGRNARGVEGWMNKFPPAPRVLYNLPALTLDPELPVLFVEGEKTAEAAGHLLPSYTATTVVNGAKAASKTDLSILKGRDVLMWPDLDKAGKDWVDRIGSYCNKAGAKSIRVVNMEHAAFVGKPEKWDLANAQAEGWEGSRILTILKDEEGTLRWDVLDNIVPDKKSEPKLDDDKRIQKIKALINEDTPKLTTIASAISLIDEPMEREELVTMAIKKHGWSKTNVSRHVEQLARQRNADSTTEKVKGFGNLNVEGLTALYIVRSKGLWPSKRVGDGETMHFEPQYQKCIASRPFWPNRIGMDAQTKEGWVELAWKNARGKERTKWMKATDAKRRHILLELDGIPITDGNFKEATKYIDTAMQYVTGELMQVYTNLGWADNRWHWPEANTEVVYAGPEIGETGNLGSWKDGLKGILDLGDKGYTAMACIGASVASCMCAIVSNDRSPVIGLTHRSSSGKGTVLNFAMSIWGNPQPRRFEQGSTRKGIEDSSINWSNIPVFADDLHNMKQFDCQNLLYFLGSGGQRTTSSADMKAQGGRRRIGTAFFASESDVTEGMQGGAMKRVWELRGAPLPKNQAKLAYRIQRATEDGAGALASVISTELNTMEIEDVRADIWACANRYREKYPELAADDGQNLALLRWGLDLLSRVMGEDVLIDPVIQMVADQIQSERKFEDDLPRAALREIIQTLMGMNWPSDAHDNSQERYMNGDEELRWMGEKIAFRRWSKDVNKNDDNTVQRFEFNHRSKRVSDILHSRYNGYKSVVSAWAAEEWIETKDNGNNQKINYVRKRNCGWVTRLTEKGMREFMEEIQDAQNATEQQSEMDLSGEQGPW